MFEQLRSRIARLIAPRGRQTRMYASARPSRLAGGWASNSSADMELVSSLTSLRSRSRQLVRDASYAKRAKVVVVNNVIGSGIGMQAQVKTTRGELNAPVNDAIEAVYRDWSKAENCHTGGSLHFHDFERAMMGQIFEAGEIFVRKHYTAFGRSRVPFALELVEPERIADETDPGPREPGAAVRMGIEVDTFYRPIAYWMRERHQGEFRLGVQRSDRYERVPADQVFHLKLTDRWPQTRGEPWMHTVVRRLQDMDGYSEAEIVAARGAANYMASHESPDDPAAPLGEVQTDGRTELTMEPGLVYKLGVGEKLNFHAPNRPNTALDPFMRYMLREVAAGAGTSYESLSRDYSQSSYSSSRLALLDDRDLWRLFQQWFIRSFRAPLHCEWLQQSVLGRAIPQIGLEAYAVDTDRYEQVRFKPRGWAWIDPTKEVEAFKQAVRCGFTTVADVIARTGDGADLEDVLEGREQELAQMKEYGLEFDTDPERLPNGAPQQAPAPVVAPVATPAADQAAQDAQAQADRIMQAVSAAMASVADVVRAQKAPQVLTSVAAPVINNNVQPAAAPEVHNHINTPEVRVENHVEAPAPAPIQAPGVSAGEMRDLFQELGDKLKPSVVFEKGAISTTVERGGATRTVIKQRDERGLATEVETHPIAAKGGQ